jgi:hypothetical protein
MINRYKFNMTFAPMLWLLILCLAIVELIPGCNPGQAGSALRDLGTRIDAGSLLACSRVGEFKTVAKCLGANIVTQGLQAAYDVALEKAQDALGNGSPNGAGEPETTQAEKLRSLDISLDKLNQEIELAQ